MNYSSLIEQCQINLGVEKLKLGAILSSLEKSDVWRAETSATTFRRYLKELNLEPNAMFQYMGVANRLIHELNFTEDEIRRIASVSMRTLEVASRIINEENKQDILNIITSMPRAEAIEELECLGEGKKMFEEGVSKSTRSLLRKMEDMSESSRIEFMNEMRRKILPSQTDKDERNIYDKLMA